MVIPDSRTGAVFSFLTADRRRVYTNTSDAISRIVARHHELLNNHLKGPNKMSAGDIAVDAMPRVISGVISGFVFRIIPVLSGHLNMQ